MNIMQRGNKRWKINIVRSSRTSEDAILDMVSDVEAWLRHALPLYKNSWNLKMKAQGIRESMRAAYLLTEEFFADCRDENINIPRSVTKGASMIERIVEAPPPYRPRDF